MPASASSLAGASVASLAALASAWQFSVAFSAVVVPAAAAPGDALGAALWAFATLPNVNCTLQLLPVTPAAASFAALPLPHATAEFVVVSAPARRASAPSVFSLPLAWTTPFTWQLWACVGASALLASAAQTLLEGGAKPRALTEALLGWRFAPPATPAGRLHATAFAFTSALLFAQYVARAAAMASAADVGALLAAAPSASSVLCVADVASHASFAAAALPSLALTKRPSASAAALLAALRSGECAAALTTAADAAFAAGGPGDTAGLNCGLPAPKALQPTVQLALPLSPATSPPFVAALGVLLAHAAAPGGTSAAAAEAAFPAAAPHCAHGARWASASSAPQPLSLRDLSGIFMLQVVAAVAAAALHFGGAAGRAVAQRRSRKGKAEDGDELLEMEAVAAENGFAHEWRDSGDSSGGAAHKETPRRRGAAVASFSEESDHRHSPALHDAVLRMQDALESGDGMGWGPPAPRRTPGSRAAPRSELLAIEADAAVALARAPSSDTGPVRHRSRTPPRGGAVSADHFALVPPPRSPVSPERSPRAGGFTRGRPALPRDGGEDFLDTRL